MISGAQKTLHRVAQYMSWVAAAAVTVMMLLTVTDVVLRLFRRPITGTYEIVGLLGAVFVSFSLAHTSIEKGHIAVDVLVRKFSKNTQRWFDIATALVSAVLFGLVSRHCLILSRNLKAAGEVTLTLQWPIHPFIFGIAIGCGLLSLVLVAEFFILITEGR